MKSRLLFRVVLPALITCSLSVTFAFAQNTSNTSASASQDAIDQMSIEQLINLVVTSPGKKEEKFSEVSAALFVITSEDIRRSGKTTLPEILRMVPGMSVQQIDGNQWAVSARGFNGVFADKLLVLVDGRSVYTPLYGGVFWNEVDTMLEDIERIEVIRGPGATLYGANAVNGVVNIITKNAKDTEGTLFSTGGGSNEQFFLNARTGGKVADTNYRLYAKYWDRDHNEFKDHSLGSPTDDWKGVQSGFRTDTRLSRSDSLTVQGDAYYGEPSGDFVEPTIQGTTDLRRGEVRYSNGANLLTRWDSKLSSTSEIEVKFYYDHMQRDDVALEQSRNTWDLDVQHRFALGESHDILYGAEYRIYRDDNDGGFYTSVDPESRTIELYTGFIQDEISLIPDLMKFTIGSKVEYSDLSGVEVLPNARFLVTPDKSNSIWAAFSRAVRTPQRFNQDGNLVIGTQRLPNGVPAAAVIRGNDDFDSEKLWAYELGYRSQLAETLSIDLATFYNNYDDLESIEPNGQPFLNSFNGNPYIEAPYRTDNLLEGQTYGVEAVADWRPFKSWRLVGSYSYINIDLTRTKGSVDEAFFPAEERTPEHQFMIRSLLSLPYDLEFDSALRYVDDTPAFRTDSYFELDARVGWRPNKNWEFSIVGQNLLDSSHQEIELVTFNTPVVEIQRSVYGKITYRF